MAQRLGRLNPESCVFFICDIQERFRPGIHKFATVVQGAQRLIRVANALEIAFMVTEQYPKGLGNTVSEIDISSANCVVEKTDFSMMVNGIATKLQELRGLGVTDVVIVGLEAHVCVQQTTLDLLASGYQVHLCVDAVSSQSTLDRACGLHRADRAGAFLTTTESVLFELLRSKDHPKFKNVQAILKETRPEEPLEWLG
mmetsp:Transcript_49504/g.95605  ORF Transcript_49504/g.95605 Transcript_49504/m.95605 type:complete len:199 (+) Transcript_49504:50-646(+)